MKNSKVQRVKYIISDLIAAGASYTLFFIYRKIYIEPLKFGYSIPVEFSHKFYLGIFLIPIFWFCIYYFTGYYKDVYRKSRLNELAQTFVTTLVGVIVIFFVAILDDEVRTYKNYYYSFIMLFILQFFLTYIPRLLITSRTVNLVQRGEIGFNTLLIGGGVPAIEIYHEIIGQKRSSGNRFVGFINVNNGNGYKLKDFMPHLGSFDDVIDIIRRYQVEEVIIAIDPAEHERINMIVNRLHGVNISIKAIPDLNDLLTGKVKLNTIFGTPLIGISHELMPEWQASVKHFVDLFCSLLALLLLVPVCLILTLAILLSSRGPILYSHERIGRYGKPFRIFKFRSMFADAEKNGPELSSKYDKRITPVGRFMRKYRLDEIPNFLNVLKGDMSIVGPRPERKYFIDQIVQRAPHYMHLHKVKPGITSWGQVKYGYAENVDQMVTRLRYDILYIENMSLLIDFKIIIYTIIIILKARGM